MTENIIIGEIEVPMKVNANTPRAYRMVFGRDMIIDLQKLLSHLNQKTGRLDGNDLDMSVVENMAYIMAKQADNSIGSIEEWLEQFGIQDIYNALADIISLWSDSKKTTSEPKKNIEN